MGLQSPCVRSGRKNLRTPRSVGTTVPASRAKSQETLSESADPNCDNDVTRQLSSDGGNDDRSTHLLFKLF